MKNSGRGISAILIVIVLVAVIVIGGGIYLYVNFQSPNTEKNVAATENLPQSASPATSTSSAASCDNYQCLISAASQCQQISAIISFSGVPFPLNNGMSISGQTKYEISQSSSTDNCILTIIFMESSLTMSEKGRQDALAQGMTDSQINTQLQTMNKSLESAIGKQIICQSSANIIAAYLTDSEGSMNGSSSQFDISEDSSGATTTYTLSSGQKLACINAQ